MALRSFLATEDGAVSVDWTVMTATLVGLGLVSATAVRIGTGNMGESIRSSLSGASVAPLTRLGDMLVQAHNFGNGQAYGWSHQKFGNSSVWGDFLGPFGAETLADPVTHEVKLTAAATAALIEFDLLVIDSWDGKPGMRAAGPQGDAMILAIDGQPISMEHFMFHGHPDTSSFPDYLANRTTTATIGGTTYALNMSNVTYASNDGGSGWNDQVWRVQLEATNPPSTFKLGLSTTSSQGLDDEAFGINNYIVHERY